MAIYFITLSAMAKAKETTSAHTPGDWRRNATQVVAHHTDEDGQHETLICEIFDEHDWWKANARLIAAAPGLLRRLESLVEDLEGAKYLMLTHSEGDSWMVTEDGWDALINETKRIIAKASGHDSNRGRYGKHS